MPRGQRVSCHVDKTATRREAELPRGQRVSCHVDGGIMIRIVRISTSCARLTRVSRRARAATRSTRTEGERQARAEDHPVVVVAVVGAVVAVEVVGAAVVVAVVGAVVVVAPRE